MTLPKEKKQARIMMHVCVVIGFLAVLLSIWSLFDKTYYIAAFGVFIAVLQFYNFKQWQKKA